MFKKILYILITFTVIGFYSTVNSYYSELALLGEGKSIRELKENIDELDNSKIDLDNKLKDLNADYELKTFLRKDLTIIEFNKIRSITGKYNTNKLLIELELNKRINETLSISNEIRLLLEEKRKLYSGLIPYIDQNYKERYLEYIKGDAKIFNEKKDLSSDIVLKKEILSSKVDIIENKIKEHKTFINDNIKRLIESRLDEKIQNLSKNESFKNLNINSKVKVLEKTINKVNIKLQSLQGIVIDTNEISGLSVQNNSTILSKKIDTYKIAIEKLEEFKNSFE